jgi:hypothetical protein
MLKRNFRCGDGKTGFTGCGKAGRFVGRGFSHDVGALDSSGVLTPEARKCHFSAACSACLGSILYVEELKPTG